MQLPVVMYRCRGSCQGQQFKSLRTIVMLSSSLLPILFPSLVLTHTTSHQKAPRYHRRVEYRCHVAFARSVCSTLPLQHRCGTTIRRTPTRPCSGHAAIPVQDVVDKPANPALQSYGDSDFATHVLISPDEAPISVIDVVHKVLSSIHRTKTELSAAELIRLGSVWYLSSCNVAKYGTYNPSSGVKPIRLTSPYAAIDNATADEDGKTNPLMLSVGDYLRIHHNPRRFRMVNDYDWSKFIDSDEVVDRGPDSEMLLTPETGKTKIEKDGVIVAADPSKGWIVLNKPAGVPTHMTVDNALENVASCLEAALLSKRGRNSFDRSSGYDDDEDDDIYVTTPQRLDQNTSGLLVVATKKLFSAYFAQLLRYKTAELLIHYDNENSTSSVTGRIGGINKLYRCLVCILRPESDLKWSAASAELELQSYVSGQRVIRHYLEPSIRAPKRFVSERPLPSDDESNSSTSSNEWPEALLKIRQASRLYNVSGSVVARNLARSLFTSRDSDDTECNMPDNCEGIMELEIELLTGRTHQIRGQLAACNFPLVGDVQYGGARENPTLEKNSLVMERLALQCCALEFIDPEIVANKTHRDGTIEYQMKRSERWNSFQIGTAWWTEYLNKNDEIEFNSQTRPLHNSISTETVNQAVKAFSDNERNTKTKPANPNLLPPRVSISRGANKYVLIRAVHPETPTQEEWFVKSATKAECGGSYHGKLQFQMHNIMNMSTLI